MRPVSTSWVSLFLRMDSFWGSSSAFRHDLPSFLPVVLSQEGHETNKSSVFYCLSPSVKFSRQPPGFCQEATVGLMIRSRGLLTSVYECVKLSAVTLQRGTSARYPGADLHFQRRYLSISCGSVDQELLELSSSWSMNTVS